MATAGGEVSYKAAERAVAYLTGDSQVYQDGNQDDSESTDDEERSFEDGSFDSQNDEEKQLEFQDDQSIQDEQYMDEYDLSPYENDEEAANNNNKSRKNKKRKARKQKPQYYSDDSYDFMDEKDDKSQSNNNKDEGSSWDQYEYTKLYTALKDLEQYGVKISVPEFVFIGFQSSGKTSAVSQAAKLAVGVMKHGTASRCPTRFKLVNKPHLKKPLIRVNGVLCADEAELTHRTLQISKRLEDENKFVKDVIEVRIESPVVPDLTFVDLPGMIKGNNPEFRADKKKLDELCAHFVNEKNPIDGQYRYMPILVREPVDVEHNTDFEVKHISRIVRQYATNKMKARLNWRQDTLFIVNKFDKQINRSPALSLIEYMEWCCLYSPNNTVLTIMNAGDLNTANMTFQQLGEFVGKVAHREQKKWNEIIGQFEQVDDENLFRLKELYAKICGIPKMNSILANRMCDIVKRVLPFIAKRLDQAEVDKNHEIADLLKQIAFCDPNKLKSRSLAFNNKFLAHLKEYYDGILVPRFDIRKRQSFAQEMSDFHSNYYTETVLKRQKKEKQGGDGDDEKKNDNNENVMYGIRASPLNGDSDDMGNEKDEEDEEGQLWKYEIPAGNLIKILKTKTTNQGLVRNLNMKLLGGAQVNRIVDSWIAMVALMPFPYYCDEDIQNICDSMQMTFQCDIWTSVRNVVLDATKHLSDASMFLCEVMRFRLKCNADLVFEYTMNKEFPDNSKDEHIKRLLQTTLQNYKKEIDVIIDEFISVSEIIPADHASILDKRYCEEYINLGRLVDTLLSKDSDLFSENKNKNKNKMKSPNKNNKQDAIVKEKTVLKIGVGGSDGDILKVKSSRTSRTRKLRSQTSNDIGNNDDDEKDDSKSNKDNGRELEIERQQFQSKARSGQPIANRRDITFYKCLYAADINHPMSFNSMAYDINKIRHLSHVFWVAVKRIAARDVIQKFSNRVMAHIKQQDSRLADAVHCGVEKRLLRKYINDLVDKTGITTASLEAVLENAPISIPKDINEMTADEISQIYGVDRAALVQEKDEKIKELHDFKILKHQTLIKIKKIKMGQFDDLQDS